MPTGSRRSRASSTWGDDRLPRCRFSTVHKMKVRLRATRTSSLDVKKLLSPRQQGREHGIEPLRPDVRPVTGHAKCHELAHVIRQRAWGAVR
jgi:hypothetical protein